MLLIVGAGALAIGLIFGVIINEWLNAPTKNYRTPPHKFDSKDFLTNRALIKYLHEPKDKN